MRIGIFSDTYPPYINGVSTSIEVLQKALEKKGHEVFIVTVNNKKLGYDVSDKVIRIPGIPIGLYDYRLSGVYPLRVVRKIKKWNLDVIHCHTEFGVGLFARVVSNQFGIPLVHTYHTMYEDYVHYVTKGYFSGASQKIIRYLTDFYCDRTATELIVPTKKTIDLFKEKYKFAKSVHIVPTGIPLEKYYLENYNKNDIENLKKSLNFKADDFIILFVGRIAKEKNIEFLIDNHVPLVKKNKNAKLMIIGDGPLMESMNKKINKLKMQDNIILTGKVPYEKIGLYYQLATVFTTASVTETQGLTVIEALAASLPIVVIDDESFKTAIEDGLNGFIFKNKKEYNKIMLKLMEDNELVETIKVQAKNSAEKHSDKYFADRILAVYNMAIEKSGRNLSYIEKIKTRVRKIIYGK